MSDLPLIASLHPPSPLSDQLGDVQLLAGSAGVPANAAAPALILQTFHPISRSRPIDELFYICSYIAMTRIDDDILSTHIEVALAGAAPTLLDDLADADRTRRRIAVTRIAHHLAERLRCFDIRSPESHGDGAGQPSLFPQDIGPIGLHTA